MYETVLHFINQQQEFNRRYMSYGYEYMSAEESAKRFQARLKQKCSFYIVKEKSKFNQVEMARLFSALVKDTDLTHYKYISSQDSIIKCRYPCCLKYGYDYLDEIRDFTGYDFSIESKGSDTIQFIPMRVTFSGILYQGNKSLLYAKIFSGEGGWLGYKDIWICL